MSTRLAKLKNELEKRRLDAVLISSVPNITYLTGFSNFSKDEREAYLLITKTKQYVITDGRYSEAVSVHVPDFEVIEINVKRSLKSIFKTLVKKHKIVKLGIEENNITVSEQKMLKSCFNDLNHFSLNPLRIIKETNEIEAIKKACNLGDKTFNHILKKIKLGVSEKEIATEIEFFIKRQGADISFPPIVAFGKNSSIPHHQTSNRKLTTENIVLLDFGVKLNNYCSDMTRTVFFGSASAEYKRMYQTVLTSQKRAIQQLSNSAIEQTKNGIKASSIDHIARSHITSQGYPTIPHSLGHGVGLEVHESPRLSPKSNDKLEPGMVFSIEPGVYIPNFGGVRIEDLVVLETSGPRLLTQSPKELTEI